jgi:hypothetical protein
MDMAVMSEPCLNERRKPPFGENIENVCPLAISSNLVFLKDVEDAGPVKYRKLIKRLLLRNHVGSSIGVVKNGLAGIL